MTNQLFCRTEYLKQKKTMNRNNEKEVVDFCRVKKIFEKGFGFLTSLYYPENVFFHFSKIKDEEMRKSLLTLKRGIVSVFFTSKLLNGKRKVDRVWLDISEVPENLLGDFINRLILELNEGKINPFEIIDALNQLREIGKLTNQNYTDIIASEKTSKNPSILLKLFLDDEKEGIEKMTFLFNKQQNQTLTEIGDKEILLQLFSN